MIELSISLTMFLMLCGFAWGQFRMGVLPIAFALVILAGLFAFVALMRIRTIRWNHRFESGCCTYCGYDLRGTPDGCPECGAKHPNGTRRDLRRWLEISAEDLIRRRGEKS